jgi:hypothetical protein
MNRPVEIAAYADKHLNALSIIYASAVAVPCWYCAGTVSVLYRYCIGTVSVLYRYCIGTVPVLYRYYIGLLFEARPETRPGRAGPMPCTVGSVEPGYIVCVQYVRYTHFAILLFT